jgi:hypothetical protein
MDINQLADIYVDWIEPAIKLGAFFILLIVVLHFINVMKEAGGSGGFVSTAFRNIVKIGSALFSLLSVALRKLGVVMLKLSHAVITTLRDFFTSKI